MKSNSQQQRNEEAFNLQRENQSSTPDDDSQKIVNREQLKDLILQYRDDK